MKAIDLTGKKFGKWTVLEKVERPKTNSTSKPLYWKCKCECGTEKIIPSHNLRCKRSLSCGCNQNLPPYLATYNRILDVNLKRKTTCELTFDEFLEFTKVFNCHYCHDQIIWKPYAAGSAYHLDRKDNDLGYSKMNCVVCCQRCNFGKAHRFTYEEWFEMTECFRRKKETKE